MAVIDALLVCVCVARAAPRSLRRHRSAARGARGFPPLLLPRATARVRRGARRELGPPPRSSSAGPGNVGAEGRGTFGWTDMETVPAHLSSVMKHPAEARFTKAEGSRDGLDSLEKRRGWKRGHDVQLDEDDLLDTDEVYWGSEVLHTVFFGLCFLTDVLHQFFSGPGKLTTLLVNIRDFLFTILAFPLGTFVCISFWTLYVIDRKLVYPKYLDDIIPLWLNHAMHTAILLLVLLELYLQPHRYPRRIRAVLCLALFCAAYLAWVLWVHHVSEIWVYPIMAHLSPAGLALFLAASALALLPLYLLGEKLSLKYWTKPGTQKKKKK
uniref:Androgen dependent TFPI regulating protein 1 n=1 Tax=Scleropages formosus TaxID=113540 RepID=A0A8C9W061_SCLFO